VQNAEQARQVLASTELTLRGIETPSSPLLVLGPASRGLDKQMLQDRGYFSVELEGSRTWFADWSFTRAVLVNGEDHLRISGWSPGFDLVGAEKMARSWEEILESRVGFAASVDLGYLTSRLNLAGLGLEGQALVHLPALGRQGLVPVAVQSYKILPVENLPPSAWVYRIDGRGFLGHKDQEWIDSFSDGVFEVVFQERKAREELRSLSPLVFDDRVWKAWGRLSSHRLIGFEEACEAWSQVRMAWGMKILPLLPPGISGLPFRLTDSHMWAYLQAERSSETQKGSPKIEEMTILDEARSILLNRSLAGGM